MRSVIGADGTEYCDRYDVTRGRIERGVRKISISSIDDFEIVKDADKSYCYYKVNLPTPILNSAVESNMFKIYHGLDDVSGTNRIYVDPEGRFFIFKYFNEQPYEQQIKPLIDAAPFEFYWYDGNVTKEAVEPIRIKSKPGYSVMEVCEKCIPKISVEYRQ